MSQRLKLTKDNVLAFLPATFNELMAECLTDRHRRRMEEVLHNLRRRGLIKAEPAGEDVRYVKINAAETAAA